MCFELVELYLENSLFLASVMTGRMHRISRGVTNDFSRHLCEETHPRKFLHLILFARVCLHIHMCVCVKVCPDGGGPNERALLLPRVYLPTVTLMQCNDYFYSRYFGSPFTLSGMTPHWPTDYLCDCCHTWLLQLSSLSTITPSASPLFILLLLAPSLSLSIPLPIV